MTVARLVSRGYTNTEKTLAVKLLGHTQVQTTARYAHLARDSTQYAAARITGSIGDTCRLLKLVTKSLGNEPARSTPLYSIHGSRA